MSGAEFQWAGPDELVPLPPQPNGVPFPAEAWPEGDPVDADVDRLNWELDRAFAAELPGDLGLSLSLVVVQGGRLVAERYGSSSGPDEPLISWSMAKSATQALAGILVKQGRLALDDPAPIPEWVDDDRRAITVGDLLRMRSGLAWTEDYVDDSISHVIDMLFGAGNEDVAGYAIDRPLGADPGSIYYYSSATSNIVSRILTDVVLTDRAPAAPAADTETDAVAAAREAAMRAFMADELFGPLQMTSADPRFDAAGMFVGSSFLYATARDFARFGLLYLRDGVWDGQRLLPEGWVDRARLAQGPVFDGMAHHGEHWWVYPCPHGSFRASGYEGQAILVVPGLDLIVVRLGKTPDIEGRDPVFDHLAEIVACFE